MRLLIGEGDFASAFCWLEGGEREQGFHREEVGEISVFRPAFSASSSAAQQQRFPAVSSSSSRSAFSAAAANSSSDLHFQQ